MAGTMNAPSACYGKGLELVIGILTDFTLRNRRDPGGFQRGLLHSRTEGSEVRQTAHRAGALPRRRHGASESLRASYSKAFAPLPTSRASAFHDLAHTL